MQGRRCSVWDGVRGAWGQLEASSFVGTIGRRRFRDSCGEYQLDRPNSRSALNEAQVDSVWESSRATFYRVLIESLFLNTNFFQTTWFIHSKESLKNWNESSTILCSRVIEIARSLRSNIRPQRLPGSIALPPEGILEGFLRQRIPLPRTWMYRFGPCCGF